MRRRMANCRGQIAGSAGALHDESLHYNELGIAMQKLCKILALALAVFYGGCFKQVEVGKRTSGGPDRVVESTNSAGAFVVKREEGKWWLVSPSGQNFFSMGVCVVSRGSSKEEFDVENPSYASWQHYETPGKWAEATTARLKQWRFTTVGGWSDYAEMLAVKDGG